MSELPEGVKHDGDKPRWDLLPFDALDEVAGVLRYGAKKYTQYGECTCGVKTVGSPVPHESAGVRNGSSAHAPTCGALQILRKGERNWELGMSWGRLLAAAMRHLSAWALGQHSDPESGLPHLAHASCCVLMLLALTKRKVGTDDRYKSP
jgi:hypothetical protein